MTLALAFARMSIMSGGDHVDPARSDVKLTYDDYLLFPEDGKLHELIDGEHFVTPSPNVRHQAILGELHGMIWSYLREHPIGLVFMSRLDVVLSKYDVVEPDLLYVSRARANEVLSSQHVRGAPDLVVEIGSPSTRKRDETIKRRLYERFGVTEYWVVDPEVDVVRVYRRSGDRFQRAVELSHEGRDMLTTPLLPGLELPLERVFREQIALG
jgi:Uma2 family endonuclease